MRIAVVPGVLALLPRYAGRVDPIPELRDACLEAVAWLAEAPEVLGDEQGQRVGRSLVESVCLDTAPFNGEACLVVANGSARRTDASPGPYDERAFGFDEALGKALKDVDPAALARIDQGLARELWAATSALPGLARLLTGTESVSVDYEAAPFGVAYWVVRYENAGR
jgi:hypothetical protein